jgi:hypothetical protein
MVVLTRLVYGYEKTASRRDPFNPSKKKAAALPQQPRLTFFKLKSPFVIDHADSVTCHASDGTLAGKAASGRKSQFGHCSAGGMGMQVSVSIGRSL